MLIERLQQIVAHLVEFCFKCTEKSQAGPFFIMLSDRKNQIHGKVECDSSRASHSYAGAELAHPSKNISEIKEPGEGK